jgi:hypothetical protein
MQLPEILVSHQTLSMAFAHWLHASHRFAKLPNLVIGFWVLEVVLFQKLNEDAFFS